MTDQTALKVRPEDSVEVARAHVANNWAIVVSNAVEMAFVLALVTLVAQCSTGAIW